MRCTMTFMREDRTEGMSYEVEVSSALEALIEYEGRRSTPEGGWILADRITTFRLIWADGARQHLFVAPRAALERVQVGDAGEAEVILGQVVELDGTYVPQTKGD